MGLLDGLENVLGLALEPLEQADKLLGEAIEKLGAGAEFVGGEAEQFGNFIAGLAEKIQTLQDKLRHSTPEQQQ
jgi:hypothetical protein